MRITTTYRKVGAFYIACIGDNFALIEKSKRSQPVTRARFKGEKALRPPVAPYTIEARLTLVETRVSMVCH